MRAAGCIARERETDTRPPFRAISSSHAETAATSLELPLQPVVPTMQLSNLLCSEHFTQLRSKLDSPVSLCRKEFMFFNTSILSCRVPSCRRFGDRRDHLRRRESELPPPGERVVALSVHWLHDKMPVCAEREGGYFPLRSVHVLHIFQKQSSCALECSTPCNFQFPPAERDVFFPASSTGA